MIQIELFLLSVTSFSLFHFRRVSLGSHDLFHIYICECHNNVHINAIKELSCSGLYIWFLCFSLYYYVFFFLIN